MHREPIQTDRADQFFQLYAPIQQRVFAYILTLVPHWADAEEILQETCVAMWRDFEQFDADRADSDFFRWASVIAFHRVLDFRKRQTRSKLMFSDQFIDAVAEAATRHGDQIDRRLRALRHCLQKVSPRDRDLIRLRYETPAAHGNVKAYAESLGCPADTLYKALARVRRQLIECIRLSVNREAEA
ncbi:sigma-70 family RNA polymerase sigma factor [Planctomycetales bacterium ZRK34]|nr:sigma-70 family RNA polymerase sigma factor [Planctomycetales bacterium ZRK34]